MFIWCIFKVWKYVRYLLVYFKGAILETFIELAKRLLEKSKRIKEGYASEQDLLSDNTQCVQKSTQGIYSKYAIPGADE